HGVLPAALLVRPDRPAGAARLQVSAVSTVGCCEGRTKREPPRTGAGLLGYVDLGHIDLMVQEGFYTSRPLG
ncbi:MAG TPA: hypothetical protein VFH59_02050, partial [Frateuria sp.]|uniref:hypothetical protein n=1 Tax=Frateuria sp. TaxID=2211372 RepID=UPI002D7F66E2